DDGPTVGPIPVHVIPARRGQEIRLAHQSQHAILPHGDPSRPQPDVHLPMSLGTERTGLQYRPDLLDQLPIVQRGPRPTFPARGGGTPMPPPLPIVALRGITRVGFFLPTRVHARARQSPLPTDHRDRIPAT